jgi:Na+/H+-dicarboxylate symporter
VGLHACWGIHTTAIAILCALAFVTTIQPGGSSYSFKDIFKFWRYGNSLSPVSVIKDTSI